MADSIPYTVTTVKGTYTSFQSKSNLPHQVTFQRIVSAAQRKTISWRGENAPHLLPLWTADSHLLKITGMPTHVLERKVPLS